MASVDWSGYLGVTVALVLTREWRRKREEITFLSLVARTIATDHCGLEFDSQPLQNMHSRVFSFVLVLNVKHYVGTHHPCLPDNAIRSCYVLHCM